MNTLLKLLAATAVIIAALMPTTPGVARAQTSEADKATARQLARDAQTALQANDFAKAADLFGRADALYHAPTLALGLARANVGLGKYVEAMEAYNRVIREKLPDPENEAFARAVEDAQREIVGLDEKIGWVTIRVAGSDAPRVTLDGSELSIASLGVKRATNPGEHVLRASADGFRAAETRFQISAGASDEVAITLVPDHGAGRAGETGAAKGSDPGATMRLVGFIGLGLGGAGIILGAVTGGLAVGKHGELSDACPEGRCDSDQQGKLDSYQTLGLLSTVGFIAGGVLAATGLVLVLVAPGDEGADRGRGASWTFRAELGAGRAGVVVGF